MLHPRIALVLAATWLAACPTEPPISEPTPPAADPTGPAGPGEARAAVLPADPTAFAASTWGGITAEARPGDFKLWNDRVRFVVRSQPGHGYVGIAGALIDADLVRPADELGRDTLEEAFLAFGIGRLASADTIRVVSDGLDGTAAVVRVEGTDVPWQFIMGVVETDEPLTPALGLRVVTDYVLPPDSPVLQVRTTLYNDTDEEIRTNPLDGLISSGEDLFSFAADEGLDPGGAEEPPSVGTAGRNGEPAFSLFLADGPLDRFGASDLLSGTGISLSAHGWYDIPPGGSAELVRYRALGRDTLSVEASRWDLQGVDLVSVSGVVTAAGAPLAGARVHVVDDSADPPRVLGFALSDLDGSWAARIPPGSWTAWATAQSGDERVPLPNGAHRFAPFAHELVNARQIDALTGAAPRSEVPVALGHATPAGVPFVAADGATVDIDVNPAGTVVLQIRDDAGGAIAGMAEFNTVGEVTTLVPESLRDRLGLPQVSGRVLRAWTPGRDLALQLPAGSYQLTVEAGPRRSRDVRAIELVAGETITETVTLETVVERDGWLSMDSHLHAAPSNDGELPMENRLIGCAASGVDLPVTTDHDRQADYRPLAAALGLDDVMTVIPGVEVSPPLRGHFNLFPIEPQGPSVVNGGAPAWWTGYPDTDGLFELMRESGGPGAVIQVNHGRDGTSAMMNASSFDPSVSEPYRPDFWSWDFDLVELINAGGVDNWVEPRQDWFSWLSTGRIKVPTGVSDSHGLSRVCGYGRTEVFVDSDDPSGVDPGAVRDALAAGHVVVSGAVTLRVEGDDGALPGDTIVADALDLSAVVRGPDWVVPAEIRLYRNGALVQTEAISGPPEDGVWWQGTLTDTPTEDSWYVVEVQGTQALGAFWGGSVAYAITNAFFVDVAGDGWEAPGLP